MGEALSHGTSTEHQAKGRLVVPTAKDVANQVATARVKETEGPTEEVFVGKLSQEIVVGNPVTC